jgi:hypothetical protein
VVATGAAVGLVEVSDVRNLLGFLIVLAYSIACLAVAFTSDATTWWW